MEKQVKLLQKYLYEAKYKAAAHGSAEAYNRNINKKTAFTQGLVSLVVGVLGVVTWNNVDECGTATNIGLIATSVVLSFGASAVGLIRSVWRYAEKEAAHHTTAGNYGDIVTDIELFFAGNLDDLDHFVDTTHERLDIYDASSAPIGKRYIAQAKASTPNLNQTVVMKHHKELVAGAISIGIR